MTRLTIFVLPHSSVIERGVILVHITTVSQSEMKFTCNIIYLPLSPCPKKPQVVSHGVVVVITIVNFFFVVLIFPPKNIEPRWQIIQILVI